MNGDVLYAWQEQTPEGWGTIHCQVPLLGVQGSLIARDEQVARRVFGELAQGHVARSGNPLRLSRFELAEVLV